MSSLIIYKTVYGFSKKYALWLSKSLNAKMIDVAKIEDEERADIEVYENIIFVSGVYGLQISIMPFIYDNYNLIKDKKIYVLAVGLHDMTSEYIEILKSKNDMRGAKLYYAKGGWANEDLTLQDKAQVRFLASIRVAMNPHYKYFRKILKENLGKDTDYTDKKYIEPLISDIKKDSSESEEML